MNAEMLELSRLRREFAQFHVLGGKVEGIQKEMVRLQEFDRKIRTLAQLGPGPLGESGVGVGGGVKLGNASLAESMKLEKEQLMAKMEKEIEALEGAAKQQEASFSQLGRFLENKRNRLSSTPSIWPVRGWLTGEFGYRRSPFTGQKQLHEGLDIATGTGTPVVAPANGVVLFSGVMPGWGHAIVLNHGYGYRTFFAHNSKNVASRNQKVKRGEVIGYIGNTGNSTGPHLHYEIHVNGVPRNPLNFIVD
jgi:murein DD-endopeptidase MepM/ murein hydrolase activator NlpD